MKRSWSASATTAKEEGSDEHHQEHNKENLGDARGGACDTTEAQYGGDDGNDQEGNCPAQHGDSPYAFLFSEGLAVMVPAQWTTGSSG